MFKTTGRLHCVLYSFLLALSACGGDKGNVNQVKTPKIPDEIITAVGQGLKISMTHSSAHLSWRPLENTQGVVSYGVFRNDIKIASLSSTNYTDVPLSASTSYRYYISAMVNQQDEYQLSDVLLVTTRARPKNGALAESLISEDRLALNKWRAIGFSLQTL